jgi:CHAT domain-containing protein
LQDTYLPVGSGFRFDLFQKTLDSDTAVIEWYITSETFLAFIILPLASQERGSGGEVKVWQSTPDDFAKLIDWANTYWQTYTQQKETWRNQLADELQTLAQILHLDELLQLLPETCNRLILIPHRFLHLFPLHALPVCRENATRFLATYPEEGRLPEDGRLPIAPTVECAETEPRYLLELFPKSISYAPSCQILSQAQQRKRPEFTHLFAIQNPTEDLFYTNLEVEVIRSFFSSAEVLAQQAATKTALNSSSDFSSAHCCHFSGHGAFNLDLPLESALIFANKERLTLGEIFGLQLDECRLITLSACETGLTDFTNTSDEYIGLPNGFLYAGSPSVVSSLWKVADLSTSLLMIQFYENLSESWRSNQDLKPGDVAVALSRSQSWLRNLTIAQLDTFLDRYNPQIEKVLAQLRPGKRLLFRESLKQIRQRQPLPFANPYYWAAFTPLGI